jgi:predicted ATP-grasp superfamily ATP-dependent carboligase
MASAGATKFTCRNESRSGDLLPRIQPVVGLKMPSPHRIFVDAVRQYCAAHDIALEIRSQGWLLIMQRGPEQRFAFGYDLGLNSAVAHRLANDKAATAEVLQFRGVPCVPHTLFLNPRLSEYVPSLQSWEAMLGVLKDNPKGLVVKPNEGTSGEYVFKVSSAPELELAAHRIFSANASLAISPYLEIENEVRVVLLDNRPLVVYDKKRDFNWRHNLDLGAQPIVLKAGPILEACVEIAVNAAKAIDIRFGSIDVVRVDGGWHVLEINSGVMMEALGRSHPELVYAAYSAALDKVFG